MHVYIYFLLKNYTIFRLFDFAKPQVDGLPNYLPNYLPRHSKCPSFSCKITTFYIIFDICNKILDIVDYTVI